MPAPSPCARDQGRDWVDCFRQMGSLFHIFAIISSSTIRCHRLIQALLHKLNLGTKMEQIQGSVLVPGSSTSNRGGRGRNDSRGRASTKNQTFSSLDELLANSYQPILSDFYTTRCVSSFKVVKQLRDETGAGMMDCKKGLSETTMDIAKAFEYL